MIARGPERRIPLSPQLALRVAVLGGVALVLFGIILFRLWYLQVLSGDQYVQLANNNRVRDIAIQAPRGDVVDRNGKPIVTSREASAVQLVRAELPKDPTRLFRRLSRVLQISPSSISQTLTDKRNPVFANVTIKTDAGQSVLNYLSERRAQFPGVTVTPVFLRSYPDRELAAQLLGNVGQITASELKLPRFSGVTQNTVVGQDGVELAYDRYLRGRDGAKRVQVDAAGQPRGGALSSRPSLAGHQLKLSLDLGLQREGELAIKKGIGLAQANGHPANAGAFVALDPTTGQVLALGSYPTFDPKFFTHPETQGAYDRLFGPNSGAPQVNRAISGLYPTGSTFKPITAIAALQSGLITPSTPYVDNGCITVGKLAQRFCNSGKVVNGTLALPDALKVSSDVFFYNLGQQAFPLPNEPIQTWARKLGLGAPTGIDLPGEQGGLIPDAAWRQQANARELRCRARTHASSCGYVGDIRPFLTGDNINFAVGQGDLQATPLQMAVAYSAIINGGTVLRPHLGQEIDDSQGRLVQRIDPPAARHVDFSTTNQQAILEGLRLAASAPGGTSADVFRGFPHVVYGKTGTAQRGLQDDQSWYIGYAPDAKRPIVIAMTIEKGGFGAEAAAPAVRLMLSQWFGLQKKLVAGHSKTR